MLAGALMLYAILYRKAVDADISAALYVTNVKALTTGRPREPMKHTTVFKHSDKVIAKNTNVRKSILGLAASAISWTGLTAEAHLFLNASPAAPILNR
jgi:hypothetical protein